MDHGFCPRCGSRRPDAFRWCRKCGFDFQNPPKPDVAASVPPVVADQPQRIDVRPIGDRRAMAQFSRDVIDIRCLGTIGGILGAIVGFLALGTLGVIFNLGSAGALLSIVGLPLGWYIGTRVALGRLAR